MKKYIIIIISALFVLASCKSKKATLVNKD
ncbi:MAG: lipoprotein, partial [Bacteroidetes bacterium]|nr:lipoprotein [Bacteroidota bacterium]